MQYLKIKEEGDFNRFNEESKKTIQNLRKIELFEVGEVFQEHTVLIVCQVLARGTVILHLRNMFHAFNGERRIENQLACPFHITS